MAVTYVGYRFACDWCGDDELTKEEAPSKDNGWLYIIKSHTTNYLLCPECVTKYNIAIAGAMKDIKKNRSPVVEAQRAATYSIDVEELPNA